MAEPQAVQLCSEAMLAHVEGRFDDARRHYAEATGQMRRNGSLHADGFHRLARLTIELSQGRTAQAEPLARALHEMTGPLAADARAVTLAAAGRAGEARRLHQEAAAMPELSAFLGRPQEAARHFATAQQVARRWKSPHWAARAAASLCPPNG